MTNSLEEIIKQLNAGHSLTADQLAQAVQLMATNAALLDARQAQVDKEISALKAEVETIVAENVVLTAFVKDQGLGDDFKEFINNYGVSEVVN